MKETYLVISDIHGALSGAEAMEKAYEIHKPDQILCLGDILYHGPRNDLPEDYNPKAVIEIMNKYAEKIIAVRGNCEAEVDQMVLDFPCMSDYNEFLLNDRKVFMSHGHIYSPEKLPKLREKDIFLSGHTHIPMIELTPAGILLNPGSISLPKGGHPRTYAILNRESFTIYTIENKAYKTLML